jgi:methyl-accepting chemotaxis protein
MLYAKRWCNPLGKQVSILAVRNSVGLKLFLTFFISIGLFVVVMGFSSYEISSKVIENKVSDTKIETMKQLVQKQDLMLEQYESVSLQLLFDDETQSFLKDSSDPSLSPYDRLQLTQKMKDKLSNYLNANKNIKSLQLYSVNGELLANSGSGTAITRINEQPWFDSVEKAGGRAVWLDTKPNGYTASGTTFAMSRMLKSTAMSNITVVLVMEVQEDSLSNDFASVKMGATGRVVIQNSDNKVNSSTNKQELGGDGIVQLTDEQKANEPGSNIATINGKESLVVYAKSAKTGWYTLGEVPLSELTQDTDKILQITLAMSIIALLLAIGIGYWMVRKVGQPLAQLRNLMKLGEQGDLRVRTNFRSKDEIGELGDSFNRMMEQITLLVTQTNATAQEVLATAAELSHSSRKTATAAKEIALATEEIAGGATSLAVESEKGNELTHHIGEQMKKVVETNSSLSDSAEEVQSSSRKGVSYMSELTVKTGATEEITRSMVDKVTKLKDSTGSIRKILEVLNIMTKQTNILSLNATIEAARAGAAGKGFMVVADEIRKMADQSRQSIEVVGQIIITIQKEIDETVRMLSDAYPMFQEQIASVKETDAIFQQVLWNMEQFIDKLGDVRISIRSLNASQVTLNDAMSNVSAVAEQSSATSQEVASLSSEQMSISDGLVNLSEKLEGVSNSLKESLARFQI